MERSYCGLIRRRILAFDSQNEKIVKTAVRAVYDSFCRDSN